MHVERHRTAHIGWLRAVVLGAVAARIGGASIARGALRVPFWGVPAMGASALGGRVYGTTVA